MVIIDIIIMITYRQIHDDDDDDDYDDDDNNDIDDDDDLDHGPRQWEVFRGERWLLAHIPDHHYDYNDHHYDDNQDYDDYN